MKCIFDTVLFVFAGPGLYFDFLKYFDNVQCKSRESDMIQPRGKTLGVNGVSQFIFYKQILKWS